MAGRTHPRVLTRGFNEPNIRAIERLNETWTPQLRWIATVLAADLDGPAVTDQTTTLTFATTANTDGTLTLTFAGGNLSTPVAVPISVSAGDSASAIAAAAELAIDGEGDLDDTIASTTDSSADLAIVYESGIGRVSVTYEWVPDYQTWDVVFAGTVVDGNYDTTFTFATSLADPVVVRTTRSTTPSDAAALAVQHESDIEADSRLFGIIASADDDGTDTCEIITESGVTDLTVTCSAPGTATLTPTETTGAVTTTSAEVITLDLLLLQPNDKLPENVLRLKHPYVFRKTAFPASTTLDLGDAAATDGVLAGVALDGTGSVGDTGTAQGDVNIPEASWLLLATFTVGTLPPSGEIDIEVPYCPLPTPRTA